MLEYRKIGIVFVHGIVGNNRIFDFLRPLVPGEYEAKDVVLEGHGGDALGFSRASMARWKAQVNECVDELSDHCGTVVGVGHSMGCLLLMSAAARGRLSRLFLMNPPIVIRPRMGLLTNALKVATGKTATDPVAAAAKDAYGVSLDVNPLHYYGWPSRYLELFREIHRTKKNVLPVLTCQLTAIFSRRDEMVSPSSAAAFETLPGARTVQLPESTHYYYPAADSDIIRQEFKSILPE